MPLDPLVLAQIEAQIEGLHRDWANGCAHPVKGFLEAREDQARSITMKLHLLVTQLNDEDQEQEQDEDEDEEDNFA